ncbi:MAG TPA: hypothetical protein VKS81_07480 [Bacteroidota bacterium]|nr:hypothetical protein [Bacteroidota bacterium]
MIRLQKILSLGLIAFQLCLTMFGEWGHTDVVFSACTMQAISSHDCGAHERHKDISLAHSCQACYRSANSTTSASTSVSGTPIRQYTAFAVRQQRFSFHSPDYYTSASKRGPPLIA